MTTYFIRLDDACPKRDIRKWDQMEILLDKYHIKPLVGVIPNCQDSQMKHYAEDMEFWSQRVPSWQAKGWILALHGFEHCYFTKEGGLNPVNKRSEFAGLPYAEQARKIRHGYALLKQYGINPQIFFAPAHTFDDNTLRALQSETDIRFISDTPTNDVYVRNGFTFIPQQAGAVRSLPFKVVTFCYHPNTMQSADFDKLENFIKTHTISDFLLYTTNRQLSLYDKLLMKLYYWRHHG